MRKRNAFWTAAALLCVGAVVQAQAPSSAEVTLGDNTIGSFTHMHLNAETGDARFWGGVTVTSPAYDFKAGSVTVHGQTSAAGDVGYSEIVANGDAATGMRVIGHFRQPVQGRSYEMEADQAVYTPAPPSAATVGAIALTGHPIVYVTDPKQIIGRAPIIADHITITLAKDAEGQIAVQSIDGDNGQVTLTPIPQKTHDHAPRP